MSTSASSSKRPASVGRNRPKDAAAVVSSPSRVRYELALPPSHMSYNDAHAGATPVFELRQDPLEDARYTPRPSDYSHSKYDRNDAVSSTPTGRKRSLNEGSIHSHTNSSRHQHSTIAQERRTSFAPETRSASSSRGVSRQSSMGKSTAAQTNHDALSGRNTPQAAVAYVGARPDSAGAVNRRHGISPDTIVDRQYSQSPTFDDEENTDDEVDKGHGPRRQSSLNTNGRWTPTILSGIIKTAASPVYSFSQPGYKRAEEQDSMAGAELQRSMSQGRKTPAKYQSKQETLPTPGVTLNQGYDYYPPAPQSTSQSYRASHPLSHAHKVSTSTISTNSSHSIQMQSPPSKSHSRHASSMLTLSPTLQHSPMVGNSTVSTANSSPLVIPHARRGAVDLRPAGRRKQVALAKRRRAAAIAASTPKVSLLQQMRHVLSVFVRALRCPADTARQTTLHLQSTLDSIDTSFRDPRTGKRVWKPTWLDAYVPLLIWLVVSLSSTISVIIWHTEVFQALDRLSTHLQEMGLAGRFLLGSLIFLTTFPPLPLYSTLIILCGFSFGLVQGFIISYVAALSGAIVVFLLSRSLLKSWMVNLLNKSGGMKRVVRAIEKRPKLLFLVRLAPYPYNLMNTLLASSPTLTLKTYTLCTALALPKLLVHCALGTSIKNFAAYNGAGSTQTPLSGGNDNVTAPPPLIGYDASTDASSSGNAEAIKHIFGFAGVGLCVGIFIYLFKVASKAVDEELDDDDDIDEYGVILSDDDEDVSDEDEESSELDRDELSIAAQTSNDINKENSMLNRRPSLPASTNIQSAQATSRVLFTGGSDSTLVNEVNRSYSQAGENIFFTTSNQKLGVECDGLSRQHNEFSPYSYQQGSHHSNNRNSRHIDSQVSLADSIAEMEKHALEMEQEPLYRDYSQLDDYTEKEARSVRGNM